MRLSTLTLNEEERKIIRALLAGVEHRDITSNIDKIANQRLAYLRKQANATNNVGLIVWLLEKGLLELKENKLRLAGEPSGDDPLEVMPSWSTYTRIFSFVDFETYIKYKRKSEENEQNLRASSF